MPAALLALVIPGATTKPPAAIVRVTVPLPVPVALVAVRATGNVPACVGVPEITPVPGSRPKPFGNPVAPKPVAPLATTVKLNACPTMPFAVAALVMIGAFNA